MPIDSSAALKGLVFGVAALIIGTAVLSGGIADFNKNSSSNFGAGFQIFVGIGFIICAFWIFIQMGQGQDDMETFKKGTAFTIATIKDRYTKTDHDRYGGVDTTYYITIEFSVIDKIYHIHAKVDNSLYEKTGKEKSIKIKYAISNPCILLFEGEL